MIDTVEKAFYPFHLVSSCLGFSIYRNSLGQTRPCLNIFYILTVWSIYACAFYYMVTFFPYNMFRGFLMFFTVMTNFFVTITYVINNIRQHKKIIKCMKNLDLIDDTLEQLGTPKEYYKMRNLIIWILIIWYMAICITFTLDFFSYTLRHQEIRGIYIFMPVVRNYIIFANTFMDIVFMFWLRYIGTRFDKINGHIKQLSKTDECGLRCTWSKSLDTHYYVRNPKNREHVLWTAMHLHLKLCRIARQINEFFGIQMTLQMIFSFVNLIALFYFQYNMMLCFKQSIGSTGGIKLLYFIDMNIWCSILLIKIIAINYICESINSKIKKTINIIYNLANLVYFVQIREDICQFVLQISFRPLNFNGMGLFYFGYKFLRKFIVTIISIMIFLVQMDSSPLSRILIIHKNGIC